MLIKLVYPMGIVWQNGKRTLDLEVASCDDHRGIRKKVPTSCNQRISRILISDNLNKINIYKSNWKTNKWPMGSMENYAHQMDQPISIENKFMLRCLSIIRVCIPHICMRTGTVIRLKEPCYINLYNNIDFEALVNPLHILMIPKSSGWSLVQFRVLDDLVGPTR